MAGSALSKLVREATIGVGLGVIGGFIWKFSITVPHKNVIDNYYKNLKKVRASAVRVGLGLLGRTRT